MWKPRIGIYVSRPGRNWGRRALHHHRVMSLMAQPDLCFLLQALMGGPVGAAARHDDCDLIRCRGGADRNRQETGNPNGRSLTLARLQLVPGQPQSSTSSPPFISAESRPRRGALLPRGRGVSGRRAYRRHDALSPESPIRPYFQPLANQRGRARGGSIIHHIISSIGPEAPACGKWCAGIVALFALQATTRVRWFSSRLDQPSTSALFAVDH